ncbi:hypothetical protein MA16_Dca028642 [Dendrobium catenatum]|uniref:Uncharacterized protein n=1 Tax=Dendrobium catenatum TaxID=906689 RepID=A0A2I0VE75_9ASPA|nr:hypothetical protein MA16_Dca028642 [Dendrobium catenatum]
MKHYIFGIDLRSGRSDIVHYDFDASEILLYRLIFHLSTIQLVLELHNSGPTGGLKSAFKNGPRVMGGGGRNDVRQYW